MGLFTKRSKSFWSVQIPLWAVVLMVLIGGGAYIYGMSKSQTQQSGVSQSYSMVKRIKKANEVVFLNVGIQTVETKTNNTKIPWTDIGIPLSEKKAIIILNYNAKFGIKKSVDITGDDAEGYVITIPKHEVIGIELDEKKPYQLYDSRGELLSASTENVDTGEIVSKTLSKAKQEEYLENYKAQINEAAKDYYQKLFASVSTDIKLTFVFEE